MAAEKGLYRRIEEIYDFSSRKIRSNYRFKEGKPLLEFNPQHSENEKVLIKLALNLFTRDRFEGMNPSDIFGSHMGGEIPSIALIAVGIRYGIPMDLPYFY